MMTPHPTLRNPISGFTLLETLIAVGVFAMAALGLMLALQSTLDAAATIQREGSIRSEIESRLARLRIGTLHEYKAETNIQGVSYLEEVGPEKIVGEEKKTLAGYWRVRVLARWKELGQPQEWNVSHLEWQP